MTHEQLVESEKALEKKPRPHYLTGEAKITKDKHGLKVIALFPSSDETIGDRGHVNISHYLFAIWNAAHILADINGLHETLTTEGQWQAIREAKPDQPINLDVKIENEEWREHTVGGLLKAHYSTIDGQPLSQFNCKFIARIKK